MAALQVLHFHYSGLLNCKPFKGKARFMVPISYSWKLGAILHIKKENCLVHTLRGPPNGRWFHTPYAIQQLKAPRGVEGRAGASTLTPKHRSQELQLQNCKVKWDFRCAQTCRATWPTASVTSLAWLPLCRLGLWLCPFALVHWGGKQGPSGFDEIFQEHCLHSSVSESRLHQNRSFVKQLFAGFSCWKWGLLLQGKFRQPKDLYKSVQSSTPTISFSSNSSQKGHAFK